MKELQYSNRQCDCCGSNRLNEIWKYQRKTRTKSEFYIWHVRNVVCAECGFAFVSPCPTTSSLNQYYADSYEYWEGQPLDYSIDKRIALLHRITKDKNDVAFVEVGGNASNRFKVALSPRFAKYTNVEVNRSCGARLSSLNDLPRGSADIIAAYFVLEHLPHPAEFLELCAKTLKCDGALVVEVPNLYVYPIDPAGLTWWEHTNHFSPHSLAALAATKKLRLREISYELCSRPCGFAAIFSKATSDPCSSHTLCGSSEIPLATACMTEGMLPSITYENKLADVRNRIQDVCNNDGSVVIWGANMVCIDLLHDFSIPSRAIVVDSNPDKRTFLGSTPVHSPESMINFIRQATLVVITTANNAERIISKIKASTDRVLLDAEAVVITS